MEMGNKRKGTATSKAIVLSSYIHESFSFSKLVAIMNEV